MPTLVSVLFNEPKLLKSATPPRRRPREDARFSALQRAEIAEMQKVPDIRRPIPEFQCSSTSRNC